MQSRLVRTVVGVLHFSLCAAACGADPVTMSVTREVHLGDHVKFDRLVPQHVAFDDTGTYIVVRAVVDGFTKVMVYDCKNNKLQVFDGQASRDNIIPRPNVTMSGTLVRLIEGPEIHEIDIVAGRRSTIRAYPEEKRFHSPQLRIQDGIMTCYSLSTEGEFEIHQYESKSRKYTAREKIMGVTAFGEQGGKVYYATHPSRNEVELHVIGRGAEKSERLLLDRGPRCDVLSCSEEYVVACLGDGSLRMFDQRTGNTVSLRRAARRSFTNCEVRDEVIILSSLDQGGTKNLTCYSCKDGAVLGGLSADNGGVLAMAVDFKRQRIAVIGTEKALRVVSYSR